MSGWVIPGDPDQVEELSNHFRATCSLVGQANDTLRALASSGDWSGWRGGAAEAFASKLGALPGLLDRAWASYNHAAWTLWEYGNELRDLQATLASTLSQLDEAQSSLTNLQASQQHAHEYAVDPTSFAGQISSAQGNVEALVAQLNRLCQESFPALVAQCVARLKEAERLGISNDLESDYQLYVSDDVASFVGQVAVGVGKLLYDVVLKSLIDLPGALLQLIEHPSWEHLSTVLGDLAAVLGLVMLVIPGLGEAALAGWVLAGLDVATMGTEAVAVITGEKGASWLDVGLDGVAVAADGLTFVAGIAHEGADSGDEALEVAWKRSEDAERVAKNAADMGLDATGLEQLARRRSDEWLNAVVNGREEDSASSLFHEAWRKSAVAGILDTAGELKNAFMHAPGETLSELSGALHDSASELPGWLEGSAADLTRRALDSVTGLPDALRTAGGDLHTVATGTLGHLSDIVHDPLAAARDAGSALRQSDPVTRILTGGLPADALHSPGAIRLYRVNYRLSLTATTVNVGAGVTHALTDPGS